MGTYVDGLFIPQQFATQYYYQNPAGLPQQQPQQQQQQQQQQPATSMEDEILKGMIKKQM